MAFTIADVRDLVRLLDEQPEWRAEVRRRLLSDELLAMPEQIAEQRRDIQRIEEQIAEQRREMVEQRRETDRRFQQVEDQIAALTRTVDTIRDEVGELKGDSLERRYREKAGAYFGRLLRRTHVLTDDELNKLLDDAVTRGVLTEDESDDLIWADAVVRGWRRADRAQVVAVAEVSWGVGIKDVGTRVAPRGPARPARLHHHAGRGRQGGDQRSGGAGPAARGVATVRRPAGSPGRGRRTRIALRNRRLAASLSEPEPNREPRRC